MTIYLPRTRLLASRISHEGFEKKGCSLMNVISNLALVTVGSVVTNVFGWCVRAFFFFQQIVGAIDVGETGDVAGEVIRPCSRLIRR